MERQCKTMKKLINQPENVVREALGGMAAAHSDLIRVCYEPNYIIRADAPVTGKVAVISGGGSGHEPLHSGFVGMGMLDAACPGPVFTSPTPDQIFGATKAADGGMGVLYIVKNYTGDVLNFEIAAQLAQSAGIEVSSVIIHDDVAMQDSLRTAGRRGIGATIFAEKICGAAAEQGYSLAQITALCHQVNANARSIGVALTSCTVPMAGKPTFSLGADEMEFGIGIHGEPGRKRMKLESADDLTAMMAAAVLEDLPFGRGDEVIVIVNGMGGTPLIELYIIYNKLDKICREKGIHIAHQLVGNYMTALDMSGVSLTMLKIDETLLSMWDAPVKTAVLRWGV